MKLEVQLILLCHVALLVTCGPLNDTQLSKKYEITYRPIESGAVGPKFGYVCEAKTTTKPPIKVAAKVESNRTRHQHGDKKFLQEVGVFEHLQKKYGDLTQYHLINMLDYGKSKEDNVMFLTLTGPDLSTRAGKERIRIKPGNKVNWPVISKIMAQVLEALKLMHGADVVHADIKLDNVAFGIEPEPASGKHLPGVTYADDAYVLDLGDSRMVPAGNKVERKGRLFDLQKAGNLLCSMLVDYFEFFEELPTIYYFGKKEPYSKFPPEIKTPLLKYFEEMIRLADLNLPEKEIVKHINYEALRDLFITGKAAGGKDSKDKMSKDKGKKETSDSSEGKAESKDKKPKDKSDKPKDPKKSK